MQAIILAGGKGTRISSLYPHIPKPMIPVKGKPILQYQIELLRKYQITDIHLSIKHLGHVIKDYFKDGSSFGVNISYIEEKEFLGTGGALKLFEDKISDEFILIYGDMVLNVDLPKMVYYHYQKNGLGTLLCVTDKQCQPLDCDLFEVETDYQIKKIVTKPHSISHTRNHLANFAVYIFKKDIFDYIPKEEESNLDRQIIPQILKQTDKKLYAYKTEEYIRDLGTPQRLEEARFDFTAGDVEL